jgi:phospholipid/cholesterol/gamma-HCH transport system substrate-binding protein
MDSQANYRLVGGFIVFISVTVIVALLWLTNLGESANAQYFTVYFRSHSLSGLQKDSYVTMKGIKVGSVVTYQISPKSIEEVRVSLRLDPGIPVTTTTYATITRNLLTGLATVELAGGKDRGAPLEQVLAEEQYPIIPEGESALDSIASSVPNAVENLASIATRVNTLLSDENIGLVSSTLGEIQKFSKNANASLSSVDSLVLDLRKLSTELTNTSTSVTKLTDSSRGELEATLTQMRKTFAELESRTNEVSLSLVSTSQILSQQVTTVGQSLADAAESFSQTSENYENPRSILTGPSQRELGPGERVAQ